MNRETLLDSLCSRDPRSPWWVDPEGQYSREECYCDSCVTGKGPLAHALLELLDAAAAVATSSGRGHDCLPTGWLATPQKPFDALRRLLTTIEA